MQGQRFGSVIIVCLTLISLLVVLTPRVTAANTRTWDGGGGDNLASTAANWDGPDTAPIAGDSVIFDSTNTKACTWDLALALASFSINSGYSGIITQAASFSVTGFTQGAGTFTGSTSYTLTVAGGGTIAKTAGTFTSSVCRLIMSSDGGSISLNGMALYDLTISGSTTLGLDLLIGHDLTIAGGKTFTVPAGTGLSWREWNMGTFTNSGTIAGASVFYVETTGTSRAVTFGTMSITGVTVFVKSGGTSNTVTLGAGSTFTGSGTFWVYSVQAGQTQTLDTSNYALSATSILIGSGGALVAGSSVITCSGNWDSSAGSVNFGTSNLTMSGATKTIKTGPMQTLYDFQVSGTVTTSSSVNVSHDLTIDSSKSLTIGAGKIFDWGVSATGTYSNLGVIAGAGTMKYSLDTADKTITFGFTNVDMVIRSKNTATASRTLTMSGSTFFAWKLTLQSEHATFLMKFDTRVGNVTIGMSFTNGTRGVVYYSYPWNILGLVTTSYYYQIGETAGTYYAVNMLTHEVESSEAGYADNVTQYAVTNALVNGTVNFLSGIYTFYCGNDFFVGPPGPGVAYTGWNFSVNINDAHNLTISSSPGAMLKFRDNLHLVVPTGAAIFIIYGNSDNITISNINMTTSTGLYSLYQSLVFNYFDNDNITVQNCTFTGLNRVIWGDGSPNEGTNNRIINNRFTGGSLVMSLHNNPSGVLISGNTFIDTSSSMMIDSVANVTISNNTFTNSGHGNTYCIDIWEGSNNIIVQDNSFDGNLALGNSWGVLLDGNYSGKTPPATDPYDVYVQHNIFKEFRKGIVDQGSNTTFIENNSFMWTTMPITDNGTGTIVNSNLNISYGPVFSGPTTLLWNGITYANGDQFLVTSSIPLVNITLNSLVSWDTDSGGANSSITYLWTGLQTTRGYEILENGSVIFSQGLDHSSLTFNSAHDSTFILRSYIPSWGAPFAIIGVMVVVVFALMGSLGLKPYLQDMLRRI